MLVTPPVRLSATRKKNKEFSNRHQATDGYFFISVKNRPTVAIIQTLPYFSNQQQPVALILQFVRELLFLSIQAEILQTTPIYSHLNHHNRLLKIDNYLTVSRQKVQALDTHQNPESNQTYSFFISD